MVQGRSSGWVKAYQVVFFTALHTPCPKVQALPVLQFWSLDVCLLLSQNLHSGVLPKPLIPQHQPCYLPSYNWNPIHIQTWIHVHSFLLSTYHDFSCHLTRFPACLVVLPTSLATDMEHDSYPHHWLPIVVTFCLLVWPLHLISSKEKTEAFTSNTFQCYLLPGGLGPCLSQCDSLEVLLRSSQTKYEPRPIVLGMEITSQAWREGKEGREGR